MVTTKEFILPFEMTQKSPTFIKKLAGPKAEPGLINSINRWCENRKKDPFDYLKGQEHIGGLTKQMFLMIVGGPSALGPTGHDSSPDLIHSPTHILKKAFKWGWFPKGTLVYIPKKCYVKSGWPCYDDTTNKRGVTFWKVKGYWPDIKMSFVDEKGHVLYCREKNGTVIDRCLAIFDCNKWVIKKFLNPLRKKCQRKIR